MKNSIIQVENSGESLINKMDQVEHRLSKLKVKKLDHTSKDNEKHQKKKKTFEKEHIRTLGQSQAVLVHVF